MEGVHASPAQLRKYLKQLNVSYEQYLSYLGRLAFQEYEAGNLPNPPLQDACRILRDITQQRARVEADLAALEQMRQAARYPRCPFCGQPVPPGYPACPACGRAAMPPQAGVTPYGMTSTPFPPAQPPVPPPAIQGQPAPVPPYAAVPPMAAQPAEAPSSEPMSQKIHGTCPGCGAPLEQDAAFCTACGKPVAGSAEATAGSPAPASVAAADSGEKAEERGAPGEETASAVADSAAVEAPSLAGTCSFCGETLEPDSLFCNNCGKPTAVQEGGEKTFPPKEELEAISSPASPESPPAEAAVAPEACPRCGTPATDPEAVFCTECGSRLR